MRYDFDAKVVHPFFNLRMHAAALSRGCPPAHNMPSSLCQGVQSERAPTRTCRDWEVQIKTTEKENPNRVHHSSASGFIFGVARRRLVGKSVYGA